MVYRHNSSVQTKSYNLVVGHRKICGAAGSALQVTMSARRGATVVDAGGCCDSKEAQFLCDEKQGGRAAPHAKGIGSCCGYPNTLTSWSGHPAQVCQTHFSLSCEGPAPIAYLVANIGILFACGVARAAPDCCCSAQPIPGVG